MKRTVYHPFKINLSKGQKEKLARAYKTNSAITIRLTKNELSDNDEIMLTKTQINKIKKSAEEKKDVDLKISKAQIQAIIHGGSLFTSLLTKLLPYATSAVSKAVPALATGAMSALGSLGINKILGEGLQNRKSQTGGFLIPQDKIDKLIAHKNLLTKKQKEQILNSLQTGGRIIIKPTKTQQGGFLGTLLASIGIPLVLKALTGKGMQTRPYSDSFLPYNPPPFIGSWNQKGTGEKKGKGLLLGKNSPFNSIPIIGDIL